MTLIALVLVLRVRLGGALVFWVGGAVTLWALGFGPAQSLFRWLGYDRDVKRGVVRSVQGRLTLSVQPGRRANQTLTIGGQSWELSSLPKRVFQAFEHGAIYRLYTVPSTGCITRQVPERFFQQRLGRAIKPGQVAPCSECGLTAG